MLTTIERVRLLSDEFTTVSDDRLTSKGRAQFLAVDQAGSIMGQITKERHTRLGIEKFKWATSSDERVRDTHKKLDGKVFSYDDPPTVGSRKVLPSEDYRCRCVAIPVFDDDLEEPNFLRINASRDDYPDDYQAIQKELDMIPESHRNLLKDEVKEIRIIEDRDSYYNRRTGVVNILKDMEEGEFIHELGRAIETKIDYRNNKEYRDLIENIVANKTYEDIYFNNNYFGSNTGLLLAFLKSEQLVSEYQGYLYELEDGFF